MHSKRNNTLQEILTHDKMVVAIMMNTVDIMMRRVMNILSFRRVH